MYKYTIYSIVLLLALICKLKFLLLRKVSSTCSVIKNNNYKYKKQMQNERKSKKVNILQIFNNLSDPVFF